MVATASVDSRSETSLEVDLGSRRFPDFASKAPPRANLPSRKLSAASTPADVTARLVAEVHQRLPWQVLPNEVSVQEIVECYVRSVTQLEQFRRDVESLLKACCRANLEFRQGEGTTHAQARDAAIQQLLDTAYRAVRTRWPVPQNALTAEAVSQPIDLLRNHLGQSLHSAVQNFAEHCVELLAKLVDVQQLGLVEWFPNNCCSYHFFKQVLIQENRGSSTEVEVTWFAQQPTVSRRQQQVGKRTTKVTHGKGQHIQRLVRHQHDVMNAIRTSLDNSAVVMPPAVVQLCAAIPAWLRPLIEVIDGTIFRERIVERDVARTDWSDVETRDEPIYGCEPAVILGPFVLTGWGPREVLAEQRRRTGEQSAVMEQQSATWATHRYPIVVAVAIAFAVAAFAATLAAASMRATWFMPAAATLVAALCTWYAAMDAATLRGIGNRYDWAALTTLCLSSQFLLLLWLIVRFYHPLPWFLAATLVACAVLSYWAARHIDGRTAN